MTNWVSGNQRGIILVFTLNQALTDSFSSALDNPYQIPELFHTSDRHRALAELAFATTTKAATEYDDNTV